MKSEKIQFIGLVFLGVAVSIASIVALSPPNYENKSRQPSSITKKSQIKKIEFLPKKYLFLLNPQEQKDYLNDVAEVLTKAKKISKVVQRQKSLFPTAWAEFLCPIQGLHPAIRANEAECEKPSRGIFFSEEISEETVEKFNSEFVKTDEVSGKKYISCPEGKFMCNPALLGFDFDNDEKVKLRCLTSATNDNCLALETNGDQISKSLSLINEANSEFWDEFDNGVNELCVEDGEFNSDDEGCDFIRTQMKHSTREYSRKLNLRYKNIARAIEVDKLRSSSLNNKACKKTDLDPAKELRDFNLSGVKFVKTGDRCFRIPSDVLVRKKTDGSYFYYTLDDSGKEEIEATHLSALFSHSDDFIHLNCGPCNSYANIEKCVDEFSKPAAQRQDLASMSGRNMNSSYAECLSQVSRLEELEVPEVILERVDQQNRKAFYETYSID